MVKRRQRAQIRAIGLDLTRYLLSLISSQFGCVRAQALAHVPFSVIKYPKVLMNTEQNRNTLSKRQDNLVNIGNKSKMNPTVPQPFHYMLDLQSCGGTTATLVHTAFVDLYHDLANLLVDKKSEEVEFFSENFDFCHFLDKS